MTDGDVEILTVNGFRVVRIAEPGTRRAPNGRPVNFIEMTLVEAISVRDELALKIALLSTTKGKG